MIETEKAIERVIEKVESINLSKLIENSEQVYSPWLRIQYDDKKLIVMIYSPEEKKTYLTAFSKDGAISVQNAISCFMAEIETIDVRDMTIDASERMLKHSRDARMYG